MHKLMLIALAALSLGSSSTLAVAPTIEVIYPVKGQRIGAVDSTFIFGNVTPGSMLNINGLDIPVYDNGAFLAFLPIRSGDFVFKLTARLDSLKTVFELPVRVPERYIPPAPESLTIVPGYQVPARDLGLTEGDLLELSFRGTPGCFAYACLSTDTLLVEMTEEAPSTQGYWGRALFGDGGIPDSVLVRGVYSGVVRLGANHIADSLGITYYLCKDKPPNLTLKEVAAADTAAPRIVAAECNARVTVYSKRRIVIGELKDSVQIIRTGPRKGYLSIFQPRGLQFAITGFYGNYLRLELAPDQAAWVPDSSIRLLPTGSRLPHGEVRLVRTSVADDGVIISFAPGAKLPFRVEEDILGSKVMLDVYGCTSDIDWIRYDYADKIIGMIRWSQPQQGVMRLTIDLNEPIWGYDCWYQGSVFNLKLKAVPELTKDLRGLRIVVDPGHSPDPGAIGPTGYKEKEANYVIAEKLVEILRDKKASVILTRGPEDSVSLYQRPEIAYAYGADIFISVHNNALPDGVNPFYNYGTSTYYYHPHSRRLAEFVHRYLIDKIEYPDFGFYHANFAVARPTGYLAILVECAFMMIPEQEEALMDKDFQEDIADGIASGVVEFIKSEKDRQD